MWIDIKGFDGKYYINQNGCVLSMRGVKILSPRKQRQGYLSVQLGRNNFRQIHRLVAEAFIPNPDNKPFVNHKDGDKKNNAVENLEWVTGQENITHAHKTGLANSKGSENKNSKLTEEKVKEIRSLVNIKSSKELANKFGVHRYTIQRIAKKEIWTHI